MCRFYGKRDHTYASRRINMCYPPFAAGKKQIKHISITVNANQLSRIAYSASKNINVECRINFYFTMLHLT